MPFWWLNFCFHLTYCSLKKVPNLKKTQLLIPFFVHPSLKVYDRMIIFQLWFCCPLDFMSDTPALSGTCWFSPCPSLTPEQQDKSMGHRILGPPPALKHHREWYQQVHGRLVCFHLKKKKKNTRQQRLLPNPPHSWIPNAFIQGNRKPLPSCGALRNHCRWRLWASGSAFSVPTCHFTHVSGFLGTLPSLHVPTLHSAS